MSHERLDDLEERDARDITGGAEDDERRDPILRARADRFGAQAEVAGADAGAQLKGGRLDVSVEP